MEHVIRRAERHLDGARAIAAEGHHLLLPIPRKVGHDARLNAAPPSRGRNKSGHIAVCSPDNNVRASFPRLVVRHTYVPRMPPDVMRGKVAA
jgi:hypothetical protein